MCEEWMEAYERQEKAMELRCLNDEEKRWQENENM